MGDTAPMKLDTNGRCCGKKPLTYKRQGMYFCTRCDAEYDMLTGIQRANFAWRDDGAGGLRPATDADFRPVVDAAIKIAMANTERR